MFPKFMKDVYTSKCIPMFSKNQCGFRKDFNTQHILLAIIEKMKASRDNKQFCAATLTDLSKAFDCVCYDLLIAKLNAYGFDEKALKLIYDYLNGRSQEIKVGSSFSSELDISYGVQQGSILGPLLFNIDICDFFFVNIISDIANCADDTTPYECDQHCDNLINNIELTVEKIFNWFAFNNLKANASKCHLFLSPYQHTTININGSVIKSSNSEKLLGITIDSAFTFKEHINTLCRKASQKLHALSRISQYLSEHKNRILFKTFTMSQFNYCPLVWMCHSRGFNNKINNIHRRALKMVYQDKKSNLQVLLQKDNSVSIHMKNLQYLATEIYKVKSSLSPEIMKEIFIFQENENYNLRSGTHLMNRNIHTAHFGTDTITNLGPKIWKIVPDEIKNVSSLLVFKSRIKTWNTDNCPCRLCKSFFKGLGFIEVFPNL